MSWLADQRDGWFPQLIRRRRGDGRWAPWDCPPQERRECRPWHPLGRESNSSWRLPAIMRRTSKRLGDFSLLCQPVFAPAPACGGPRLEHLLIELVAGPHAELAECLA